jgi:hypothetical protein
LTHIHQCAVPGSGKRAVHLRRPELPGYRQSEPGWRRSARDALGKPGRCRLDESGTARLEEAVTAYHAALEELTRDRVPLDWATTQNNLAVALYRLGEQESGTARLEEAVTAYWACAG